MKKTTNIKALIPDYALGLLNPEQEQEVEAFLESCESCQAELENYTTMFVSMVESLPQLEPEASFNSIKQSVLNTEHVQAKQTDIDALETPIISEPQTQQPRAKAENTFLKNIQQLFTTWRYQSLSTALTLGLAVMSFWGWGQYQTHLNTVQTQSLVTQWLSNETAKNMPLTSETGEMLGSLIANTSEETALLILSNPPAKDRVYQVWGEVNKVCLPIAMSDNNIFEVSWQDKDIEAIVVSSEPLGGSEQSTDVVGKVEFF